MANYRSRAWIEIDTKKLADNYLNLQSFLPEKMHSICIVKGDAYGHGAVQEAKILNKLGVRFFGVAAISEAIELRDNGIVGDILILSHTVESQLYLFKEYDFIQTVGDYNYGLVLKQYASENDLVFRINFKIDTGMHRLGISLHFALDKLKELSETPYLKLEGCFSHFCVADSFQDDDIEFTKLQVTRFNNWLVQAKEKGINVGYTHIAASAGIVNYPEYLTSYDYCRPGILLLGFDSGDMKHPYNRTEVLSLYSQVEKIDILPKEETIGYGRTYQSNKDIQVATIPIGYGDGIPRNYSGYVLIRGIKCPIIGRISMDQLCVDVSEVKDVCLFDLVTLIGISGNEQLTLRKMADQSKTIPNELSSQFTKRLPRIYR